MRPWDGRTRGRGVGGGRGRDGVWRGGSRGRLGKAGTDQAICRHFQQTGACRFGLACKFSHDLSLEGGSKGSSKERPPRPDETPEEQRAKADYHSWKRIIKSLPRPRDERTMEQLWNGALAILNGDEREWKQMVPRDLDDESYYGRQHIETLLTMRPNLGDCSAFIRLIRPFLLAITHSSFLDCLSVDTFVGGLYNYIGGTNGTRAVPFFQHLCETLVNAHIDTIPSTTAATRDASNGGSCKGIASQEDEQWEALLATTITSAYPRALVIPRDCHDNDKADITRIRIFPTREEILSDEADFLPSTDFDQPHFLADQAERHIDTHFRLLRHDTFGDLKYLLGGLMNAVQNDPTNPRLNFGDFPANQYANAYISYVSFDSRRGLEMNISFAQPSIVRKKSTLERRKWWEESKRLSEGVLLSFISFQHGEIQHLFFTVAEKNTDTSKDHGLTKKDHQGTITAKPASHDQMNVESAVRLSCQKARGLLIEFPGILPATFIPILENLQDMQRLSRLPFRQWILPGRISDTQEAAYGC